MFQVDYMSRTPIYEQITEQIERFIASGILKPGDQLPSVRSLSAEISVNPNTIQKAYGELDAKGMLTSVPGRGCFVSSGAFAVIHDDGIKKLPQLTKMVEELIAAGVNREEIENAVSAAFGKKG